VFYKSWKSIIHIPWFLKPSLGLVGVILYLSACAPVSNNPELTRAAAPASGPIPILAYYYIWFDPTSWNRAKVDYPLLGRYSSDDVNVMKQHIEWAKAAGINGFIVSWKGTNPLNRRLDQLVKLADEENFKLAIIYQGLDFNRDPLPASQVSTDLDYFIRHFAKHPAFSIYEKPLVIWSGTWQFSEADVQAVTAGKRDHLLILASEKNVDGYKRLSGLVDGDAYYWSSVNPDTFSGYVDKLNTMAAAIHAAGGLWIAPAAVGFDARLVGGTTIVDRKDGKTLDTELNSAFQSSPDAIGLISWNEFSENSHIEPSEKYGKRYLEVLTNYTSASVPASGGGFDSSDPGPVLFSFGSQAIALGGFAALMVASIILIIWRNVPRKSSSG